MNFLLSIKQYREKDVEIPQNFPEAQSAYGHLNWVGKAADMRYGREGP